MLRNFVNYFEEWFYLMSYRTINIISHTSLEKNIIFNYIFMVIIILLIISSIIVVILKKKMFLTKLFIIIIFYVIFLFWFVNYRTYLVTNSVSDGVQGRYLFPVICFFVLGVYSLSYLLKCKCLKILVFSGILLFLFYSDFYYFFIKEYDKWFFPVPGISYDMGNIGRMDVGLKSPRQFFTYNKKYFGLGIYASTYSKKVGIGYLLNIYDTSYNIVEKIEIPFIRDNKYLVIPFNRSKYEDNKKYLFELENVYSPVKITLWYSSIDLPGNIENSKKDLVYSLLDEETIYKFSKRRF